MPTTTLRRNPEKQVVNAFSVDVEEYFQVAAFEKFVSRSEWESFEPRVEHNTRWLLEFLATHSIKATFFVLGWIAERWPELTRQIHRQGHEIASHGYDHQRVTSQTTDEFRADIAKAKRILEDIVGVEVIGYRAPTYSIVRETLWALDIVLDEGYRYDSSIFPIRHDLYGIPGASRFPSIVREKNGSALWEFPISTVQVGGLKLPFVGGGFTRQFPLRFVRWGMRRLNLTEGQPAILYVHPWEIDPGQPRQAVSFLSGIRHYRNLRSTGSRLAALAREFRFAPVREVLGL